MWEKQGFLKERIQLRSSRARGAYWARVLIRGGMFLRGFFVVVFLGVLLAVAGPVLKLYDFAGPRAFLAGDADGVPFEDPPPGAERPPAPPEGAPCEIAVVIPPLFRDQRIQIVIREGGDRLEVIPATYRTVSETVVVAPAHREGDVLEPATVTVIVEEPSERLQIVPPVFRRETVRYMTAEAHTSYEIGPDGAIVTTEHPARTAEISVLSVAEGPKVRRVAVPGKTASLSLRKVSESGGEGPEVPAQTREIKRRVMDTPPSVRRTVEPPEVYDASVRLLEIPSSVERIPETCE